MYQIIIVPKESNANSALFYKTKEEAESQFNNICEMQKGKIVDVRILKATDDFGNILSMPISNLAYALFIDTEKQKELGNPSVVSTIMQ